MTRRWPLLLLALPAFVATWSGWVRLGEMCGFGVVKPLPGITDFEINTAITLPIGVETYAAFALGAWLSHRPGISAGTRGFAKWSAVGSLILGGFGQVAFHLLEVAGYAAAPWQVTTAVSCLPVLVLGFGAALGHMLSRDAHAAPATVGQTPTVEPEVQPDPVPDTPGYTPTAPVVPVSQEVFDWSAEQDLFGGEDPEPPPAVPVPEGVPDEPEYVPGDVPEELRHRATSRFLADVITGELPGVRRIKDELGIGQPKAQQVRAYLATLATQ